MAGQAYFTKDIERFLESIHTSSEGTAKMIKIAGGDPRLMIVFRYARATFIQAMAVTVGGTVFDETPRLERELFAMLGEGRDV